MRGQPLEQNRGGLFETDPVRKRHDPLGGRERMGGVTAGGEI